jgi:antitoxin PrlF
MPTATLTAKGQTTVPKEIRDHLGLRAGDRLEFLIDAQGCVVLLPVNVDVADLKGMLPRPKQPVTLEQMDAAVVSRGGRV